MNRECSSHTDCASTGGGDWITNDVFYSRRRLVRPIVVAFAIFSVITPTIAFILKGNPIVLLLIPLGFAGALSPYVGLLLIPSSTQITENQVLFRYQSFPPDKVFLWDSVGRISAKKMPRDILKLPQEFLMLFFDEDNERMSIVSMPISTSICKRIHDVFRKRHPDKVWQFT